MGAFGLLLLGLFGLGHDTEVKEYIKNNPQGQYQEVVNGVTHIRTFDNADAFKDDGLSLPK